YLEAPALNPAPALAAARIIGHGGHAHQRSDLAPVQPAQLRQLGNHRGTGHRPGPPADSSNLSNSPKCSCTSLTICASISSSCALMAATMASMLACSFLSVICSR